jgi:hypothetical protein
MTEMVNTSQPSGRQNPVRIVSWMGGEHWYIGGASFSIWRMPFPPVSGMVLNTRSYAIPNTFTSVKETSACQVVSADAVYF